MRVSFKHDGMGAVLQARLASNKVTVCSQKSHGSGLIRIAIDRNTAVGAAAASGGGSPRGSLPWQYPPDWMPPVWMLPISIKN
jgi:hypothetical protein